MRFERFFRGSRADRLTRYNGQVGNSFRSTENLFLRALFSSATGERQSMIAQIWIYCSIDFVLHLYTGSGNLSDVKAIDVLLGHHSCAACTDIACGVGSLRHGRWIGSSRHLFERYRQWCCPGTTTRSPGIMYHYNKNTTTALCTSYWKIFSLHYSSEVEFTRAVMLGSLVTSEWRLHARFFWSSTSGDKC